MGAGRSVGAGRKIGAGSKKKLVPLVEAMKAELKEAKGKKGKKGAGVLKEFFKLGFKPRLASPSKRRRKGGKMTIRGQTIFPRKRKQKEKAVVVAKPLTVAEKGARSIGGKRRRRRKRAKLEE